MNDPHSHTPQASGCGCSRQSTTETAAATVPPAPAACCSTGAAEPPETAKNDEHRPKAGGCCTGGKVSEGAATVTDPVCGMTVDPAKTAHHAEHAGQTYDFCSAGCRTKFVANPNAYLGDKPKPAPMATPGAIWTCPMHPQIRQEGPGTCPICGMALEPEEPSLDDGPNPELVDFTRRLWVAGVLAVPLLAISMVTEMLGIDVVNPAASPWVQLALSALIVLWASWPFFQRGWTSLRTRHLNMFTLISIGVGAAFVYSLVATVAPGIFPPTFRMHGGVVPVYYEAAGVVVALVLLRQVLELRARAATGRAIRALMDLAPKTARRVRSDGSDEEVSLAERTVRFRAATNVRGYSFTFRQEDKVSLQRAPVRTVDNLKQITPELE